MGKHRPKVTSPRAPAAQIEGELLAKDLVDRGLCSPTILEGIRGWTSASEGRRWWER